MEGWYEMIYAIFGGCYSDWKVFGYFTTREEAESFCERANKSHGQDRYRPDDLYVKELRCLDGIVVAEKYRVTQRFKFYKDAGSWDCFDITSGIEEVYDLRENLVEDGDNGDYVVTVYVDPDDQDTDKPEKIARDEFFMWLAGREGV